MMPAKLPSLACAVLALSCLPGGCAAIRQEQAAERFGIPKEITLDLGEDVSMIAVLIPPGRFTMGAPLELFVDDFWKAEVESGRPHPFPPHEVTITKPFYMGKYEVTNRQFRRFLAESGYDWKKAIPVRRPDGELISHRRRVKPFPQFRDERYSEYAKDDQPVSSMDSTSADAFCKWLSRRSGRVVRLPTEAEWEYACRADTTGKYYFGPRVFRGSYEWTRSRLSDFPVHGMYTFGMRPPKPVGGKLPNPWGLHDMLSNVPELCSDWYAPLSDQPQTDPTGPAGPTQYSRLRVVRGDHLGRPLTPCYERGSVSVAEGPIAAIGFRICVEAKPLTAAASERARPD